MFIVIYALYLTFTSCFVEAFRGIFNQIWYYIEYTTRNWINRSEPKLNMQLTDKLCSGIHFFFFEKCDKYNLNWICKLQMRE